MISNMITIRFRHTWRFISCCHYVSDSCWCHCYFSIAIHMLPRHFRHYHVIGCWYVIDDSCITAIGWWYWLAITLMAESDATMIIDFRCLAARPGWVAATTLMATDKAFGCWYYCHYAITIDCQPLIGWYLMLILHTLLMPHAAYW